MSPCTSGKPKARAFLWGHQTAAKSRCITEPRPFKERLLVFGRSAVAKPGGGSGTVSLWHVRLCSCGGSSRRRTHRMGWDRMKTGMEFGMGWEDSRKTSFPGIMGQRLMVRHKEGSRDCKRQTLSWWKPCGACRTRILRKSLWGSLEANRLPSQESNLYWQRKKGLEPAPPSHEHCSKESKPPNVTYN